MGTELTKGRQLRAEERGGAAGKAGLSSGVLSLQTVYTQVTSQVTSKVGYFSEAGAPNLKQAKPTWRRAPVGEGAQIRKAGGFLNLGGASREGFKVGDIREVKMPSFESPWVYRKK